MLASHAHPTLRILPQLQKLLIVIAAKLRLDEISDLLIIDLQKGYLDVIFSVHFVVIQD